MGGNVQDMMVALKNCKVVVGCLSNNFEANTRCNDLFTYVKQSLNKPTHIAVMDENMNWKQTDLGMKIGQPVCYTLEIQSCFLSVYLNVFYN